MISTTALALLEDGFDKQILDLRSGNIGNVVNLTVSDCGFERVNGKGIAINVDGLLPFMAIDVHVLKSPKFEAVLREAYVLLDDKHDSRLSKGTTKWGRKLWANHQASNLYGLISLTLELQDRAPGRTRCGALLKLKHALITSRTLLSDPRSGSEDGQTSPPDAQQHTESEHSDSDPGSWREYSESEQYEHSEHRETIALQGCPQIPSFASRSCA